MANTNSKTKKATTNTPKKTGTKKRPNKKAVFNNKKTKIQNSEVSSKKLITTTIITFLLLGATIFGLLKSNIISINLPKSGNNQVSMQKDNKIQQNLTESQNNNGSTEDSKDSTSKKDKGASIGPKKPIVPTKKPTPKPTKTSSNGSGFIIPKDIRVKPDASDAIKAVAKLHTYYAYYYGKAEDLSKNYPKNTIVFGTDEVANRSESGEWHTNHIRIILPKTCAKIKLNEFSDVYKITIDENDLSFNSLEKDNAMENTQYFLFDDCKGIAKTKYKKVVAGVFHRDFSKISDKYFKHFDYLSKPHQKRGLFGSWSTKYVFPDNISAKYKLQENKAYVILTTSKATTLDTDMYMLTGEIEVR